MSALAEIYFKKETLQTLVDVVGKKGDKGVSITVSVSDDTNDYGQNVSAYVSQNKEDREAKKTRYFTGNGKVFWTDGTIKVATKQEAQAATNADGGKDSELPF